MNQKQALTQARSRWGKTGAVKHEPGRSGRYSWSGDYVVGNITGGLFFEIKGEGATWTEALARADMTTARTSLNHKLLGEGYRWTEPDPGTDAIDSIATENALCDCCGLGGLSYYPAAREDGTGYRGFAVCGSCGGHQELPA